MWGTWTRVVGEGKIYQSLDCSSLLDKLFAVASENQDLELDLSSLGAMNTMFAAIFRKLGVLIKTTVSAIVLEEALNGTVTIQPITLGQPIVKKVEKQCAHF
ncbi:hypothetical protein Tco_0827999 [Tanacetum coccineum]